MNVFIVLRDLFIDLLHAYSAFADDPITETVPKPQSDRRHGHRKYGGPTRSTDALQRNEDVQAQAHREGQQG